MDTAPATTLAEASPLGRLFLYGGLLIAAVVMVGSLLLWMRRRLQARDEPAALVGFSIDELEAMRGSGRISDEEFRRLRAAALGLRRASGGPAESQLSNPSSSDDEEPERSGEEHPRPKEDQA